MLNVSFIVKRFNRRLSFLIFVLFGPILSQKRITTIPDVDVTPLLFRFANTIELSQLIDSAGGKFELVNQFVNIRKRIKSKQLAQQVHSLVELVRPNVPMRPVQRLFEPRQIESKHFSLVAGDSQHHQKHHQPNVRTYHLAIGKRLTRYGGNCHIILSPPFQKSLLHNACCFSY